MGYLRVTSPDAPIWHGDSKVCPHCARIWVTNHSDKAAIEAGGYCRNCDDSICGQCDGKPCTPHIRKVEAMEHRAKLGCA